MFEKLYFSAAARDPGMADLILAFGARRVRAERLLTPSSLGRALWANLRHSPAQNASPRSHSMEAATSSR